MYFSGDGYLMLEVVIGRLVGVLSVSTKQVRLVT